MALRFFHNQVAFICSFTFTVFYFFSIDNISAFISIGKPSTSRFNAQYLPTPKKKSEFDDEKARLKLPIAVPDQLLTVDELILNDAVYAEDLVS